jgi:hypothetical protein
MSDERVEIMENFMQFLAENIDQSVQDIFNTRLGFVVLIFPFGETDRDVEKQEGEQGANYVSNAEMEDVIKALRETADRLEAKETIGTPIGSA